MVLFGLEFTSVPGTPGDDVKPLFISSFSPRGEPKTTVGDLISVPGTKSKEGRAISTYGAANAKPTVAMCPCEYLRCHCQIRYERTLEFSRRFHESSAEVQLLFSRGFSNSLWRQPPVYIAAPCSIASHVSRCNLLTRCHTSTASSVPRLAASSHCFLCGRSLFSLQPSCFQHMGLGEERTKKEQRKGMS